VNGSALTGIIQNPEQVKKAMRIATKNNTLKQAKIKVSIKVVDKETLEPTGDIVNDIPINKMFKDEKILGFLKPNMGNVSEALLGCAVAAKFEKQNAMVTEEDIKIMGQRLAEGKGLLQTTAGKDTLQFKVTVPFKAKKVFFAYVERDSRRKTLQDYGVSEDIIATMSSRVKSAAQYANNSKRILSAIKEASDDPGQRLSIGVFLYDITILLSQNWKNILYSSTLTFCLKSLSFSAIISNNTLYIFCALFGKSWKLNPICDSFNFLLDTCSI
jgi:hypothetical protein